MALSNVPGPRKPLYWGNTKLHNWFSTGQIIDGTCLNMTMWSYCDNVNLCVLGEREAIPDGWKLFNFFREELGQLVALLPATDQERASA